jgi:predicted DNA-binding protein with PD1-like motif
MKYRGMGDGYWVLKALPGEELVGGLTAFLNEMKIGSGFITGIGAASEAEIGHFDPVAKDYHKETFPGPIEIISLNGNVSRVEDGQAFVHVHAALSLQDMSVRAGHLFRAVIMPTCEITLRVLKGTIERRLSPELGLKLWQI